MAPPGSNPKILMPYKTPAHITQIQLITFYCRPWLQQEQQMCTV